MVRRILIRRKQLSEYPYIDEAEVNCLGFLLDSRRGILRFKNAKVNGK